MATNIFDFHNRGTETRDAAKQPVMHRRALTTKNYAARNV